MIGFYMVISLNVAISTKNEPAHTPETCCAVLVYGGEGGGGGAAIMNQGVGAGRGSPACSTSRTCRREPIKIGTLLGGK